MVAGRAGTEKGPAEARGSGFHPWVWRDKGKGSLGAQVAERGPCLTGLSALQ